MYTALRATSKTLVELLRQRFIADPDLRLLFDPVSGGTMIISLNSPNELIENNQQGLSVWLYRLERDSERLNSPPERIGFNLIRRTPLPLHLHYLLTPIIPAEQTASPETEQAILGKALQVLYDHPILSGADLQDDFSGTQVELHVRLESLSVDEMARVYDALERSYQLSVSYDISLVLIDSALEPEEAAPVLEVVPEYGVIVD